jgi:tetratricopeptide (TPR) repeat protein
MLFKRIIALFIVVSMFSSAFASAGATGGQIFAYNPNPITTAMGDAGSALFFDQACSSILNPASTIDTYRIVASLSNSLIFSDIQYNYLGAQFPTIIGNFGFSLMYVGYGVDYFDNVGKSLNMDAANDIGIILNYSIDLKKTIPLEIVYGGIGVNCKVLRSSLGGYNAEALAVDIGGILTLPSLDNFSLGMAYKNLGSKINFVKESYNLPQAFVVGIAHQESDFYDLKIAIDYNNQTYSGNFFSAGASISPSYFLDLRAGVKLADDSLNTDARMGVGLKFQNVNIDYSYTPDQKLGGTHSVNLSCALGQFTSEKTAYDYYMQNHFREAVECYQRKDYISAREKFSEILAVFPGHIQSQKYLKKIMNELASVDAYNASLIDDWLRSGNKALQNGNAVKARKNFNKILEIDPENALAKNGIEKTENYTNKVSIEVERDKNRKRIEYLWKRSKDFYKKGDLVRSRESLSFILDIDSENQTAKDQLTKIDNQLSKIASDKVAELYNQGKTLFNQGKYEDSIRYFEAVIVASPNRMDVRELIDKAKKSIKEVLQFEKSKKLAASQEKVRGDLEHSYEQALNYYNKNNLTNAVKYFKKSKVLADKYNFEEYITKINNYISSISKDLSEIHYKKGFELYRGNKFEAALKEYKTALEYNSNNTSASFEYKKVSDEFAQKYYEQGMSFYSKGEFVKASELLRKSLTYNPNKIEAKRALEKIQ